MIRIAAFACAVFIAAPAAAQDAPNWDPRIYTCADYAAAKERKSIKDLVPTNMAGAYMYGMIHMALFEAGKRASNEEMWAMTRQGMESCISINPPEATWADVSGSSAKQFAEKF